VYSQGQFPTQLSLHIGLPEGPEWGVCHERAVCVQAAGLRRKRTYVCDLALVSISPPRYR